MSLKQFIAAVIILAASLSQVQASSSDDAAANHAQKRDSVPDGYTANPYYPTPKGGWVSSWAGAYAKAAAVVSQMTLAEKVNLTTGTGLYFVRCLSSRSYLGC